MIYAAAMLCAACKHPHGNHSGGPCLAAIPAKGYRHGSGAYTTGTGRGNAFRSVCPCNACKCSRCTTLAG